MLDDGLKGRATNQSRIYDLGQIAQVGLDAPEVRPRASEVLTRASHVLPRHGFAPDALEPFCHRLETGRLPADDLIDLYHREQSIPAVLRHLTALVPRSTHLVATAQSLHHGA